MDETQVESLIKKVQGQLELNPDDLDGAVNLAEEFCNANQIELETLVNLSVELGFQSSYEFAYVFAKVGSKSPNLQVLPYAFCNAGLALQSIGRLADAEKEYLNALEIDSNHLDTHYNYGILLEEIGRLEDAEKEYQTVLEIDSNHLNAYYNYGEVLQKMDRFNDAENLLRIALIKHPNDSFMHSNYGYLLLKMGLLDDSEKEYKIALKIDPKNAKAHGAYGFVLFEKNDIQKSLDESYIASSLFKEEGNKVMEHLSVAWIHELIADRYYEEGVNRKKSKGKSGGNFRKSGEYASIAGDEYLLSGEYAGGKEETLYLTKGYTLKGRAEIRKLDLPVFERLKLKYKEKTHPKSFAEFRHITSSIRRAAENYKVVVDISGTKNSSCSACYTCMIILKESLDIVNATTNQEKVPDLKEKIAEWNSKLELAENTYSDSESEKGMRFVHALKQLISSISHFENFKTKGRGEFEENLGMCVKELKEISDNIEGPLQEVIDSSAQQMNKCAMKMNLYIEATETKPLKQKTFFSHVVSIFGWVMKNPVQSIITGLIVVLIAAHFGL